MANNDDLPDDRFAKICPLYSLLNAKLNQFGVFKEDLLVDEQMLPYFGRHSGKMYMRGKPVKFGYKLWVLASASGYPFQLSLYAGKTTNQHGDGEPLGSRVILQLLECIQDLLFYSVTFDNFFTSINLLNTVKENRFAVTGTVRYN